MSYGPTTTFSAALALILAVFQCIAATRLEAQEIKIDNARLGVLVFNATNAYRESNHLPRLKLGLHAPAGDAAQKYAEYLAQNNSSGHEADGKTPEQRIVAAGGKVCAFAENVETFSSTPNVADIQTVANTAMKDWKNSPQHDSNLKSTNTYILGIGAAAWKHADRNYYMLVQDFLDDCTPADQRDVRKLGKRPKS